MEEAALKKSVLGSASEEALKDAKSSLQTAFGKKFKEGKFDAEIAEKILIDLFGKSEDDAYWTIKKWETGQTSEYEGVLDAVLSGTGFNEAMKEMTDHGYEKEAILNKIKNQIKTWYTDEESEVRISKQEATEMLRKYVGMKADEVTSTINQWSSKVVTGIAYDDIKDEFMSGKITASRAIDMRVRYGGETTEEARAKVEDWNFEKKYGFSYSNRKDAYINGEVSATTLRQAMISHKGMTAEDADNEIRALDLLKRNPNSGLDLTASKAMTKKLDVINKSLDECGIKPDVYKKYKDLCKTAGSKKEDILGVIHSLPLSVAQKDALYYLNGWSEKTINEAPWH